MTTAPTADFEALRAEVRAYVEDEGERWAQLIERESGCRRSCGTSFATADT